VSLRALASPPPHHCTRPSTPALSPLSLHDALPIFPTGPRPTASSSASTALWATAEPMPSSTRPPRSATQPCPGGCTSTIPTDPTPPSEASHQSPDLPTSLDITASTLLPLPSLAVE